MRPNRHLCFPALPKCTRSNDLTKQTQIKRKRRQGLTEKQNTKQKRTMKTDLCARDWSQHQFMAKEVQIHTTNLQRK